MNFDFKSHDDDDDDDENSKNNVVDNWLRLILQEDKDITLSWMIMGSTLIKEVLKKIMMLVFG
jgi:hypothetical protein